MGCSSFLFHFIFAVQTYKQLHIALHPCGTLVQATLFKCGWKEKDEIVLQSVETFCNLILYLFISKLPWLVICICNYSTLSRYSPNIHWIEIWRLIWIVIVLEWLASSSGGNTKGWSHVWEASQSRTMAFKLHTIFWFSVLSLL